jgi:Tol biopolymer transport system component
VYTAHTVGDEGPNPGCPGSPPFVSDSAEIYKINADGTGTPERLNGVPGHEEERGPSWSPDGTQIVFAGRGGSTAGGSTTDFEIWVMNADGSCPAEETCPKQLTDNSVQDLTPTFSPDSQKIVFHRQVTVERKTTQQLFVMNADGSPQPDGSWAKQLTYPDPQGQGFNNLANWGVLRVHEEPAP